MQTVGEEEAEGNKIDSGKWHDSRGTTFGSLLAICATPVPTPIHRYEDVYFELAHIGDVTYLAISRKEKAPFIEYDLRRREWRLVDPAKESFSGDPNSVIIPMAEVKELSGKVGEEIKKILAEKS